MFWVIVLVILLWDKLNFVEVMVFKCREVFIVVIFLVLGGWIFNFFRAIVLVLIGIVCIWVKWRLMNFVIFGITIVWVFFFFNRIIFFIFFFINLVFNKVFKKFWWLVGLKRKLFVIFNVVRGICFVFNGIFVLVMVSFCCFVWG